MEMVDDLADIREMYNAAWDVEDSRLERHKLEAHLTWRYLARHLPPAGRLLEIGCGTGAYTLPLAKRGYRITAVDFPRAIGRMMPRGVASGYFVRPEEVAPMHEAVGFRTVRVAGVEPIVSAHDEVYNNLPEGRRAQWLDLLFEVSTEPSIIGLSVHLLYVGCRES